MQHFGDGFTDLVFFFAFEPHTERNVLVDVQMREKRVLLKDRVDGALMRRHVVDLLITKKDIAAIRCDEAADGAQNRGFAAAGGPEQRYELAVTDGEVKTCSPSNDTAMSLSVMIGFNMESIPFAVW